MSTTSETAQIPAAVDADVAPLCSVTVTIPEATLTLAADAAEADKQFADAVETDKQPADAVEADKQFAEALIAAEHAAADARAAKASAPAPPPSPKVMTPTEFDSPADVVLRIRSRFASRIAAGKKNHEFRTYKLHSDVQYVWLWEDDDEVIRWIITVGDPKRPGEVNDPTGDGNDDFDAGLKASTYGYPIYEVYRLPFDLTRGVLRDEYGIDMADGRQYVKRALVEAFPLDNIYRIIPWAGGEEEAD